LAFQMPQRVFQLHQLDEKIVFRVKPGSCHRRLEVEAEPLLDSQSLQLLAALGQVQEKHQVEHDGRCQNGITTEEIDLDLHGVAQTAKDVDVVPALFVIATRRVIVNAHFVVDVLVELGIKFALQDTIQRGEL